MPIRIDAASLKAPLTVIAALAAIAAAIPAACTPDRPEGRSPPDGGNGGFNPGTGLYMGSSSSSGGNSASGGSGGSGGLPCDDDDSLKRCPHKFTYPDMGEGTVEVRGDWNGPSTWVAGA